MSYDQFEVSWDPTHWECAANEFEVKYSALDYCGIETNVTLPLQSSTSVTITGSFSRFNVEVIPLKTFNGASISGKPLSTAIYDISSGKVVKHFFSEPMKVTILPFMKITYFN